VRFDPGDRVIEAVTVSRDYRSHVGPFGRSIGEDIRAVSEVSIDVHPGEILCVVGHAQSGKSTLLKLLAGAIRPTAGVVRFASTRERTGRLVVGDVGIANLSAKRSNRRSTGALLAKSRLALKPPDRTNMAVRLAGLEGLQRRSPRTYSTSQRWLFEVAWGVLSSDVLLVDDLFLLGGPDTKPGLRALLATYVRQWGGTLVFSSGDVADARKFADRVAVLDHGRCQVVGPTDEVAPPPPPAAFSVRLLGPAAVAFTGKRAAGQAGEALADVRIEGESAFLDLFRKVLS
jgi:ABC-type sulfate/molybdate transport systems ATPase subunit